ncbi:histone deacetylase HDT2-like [Ipomoea triloba]|uniref:histone deacetylase HDT2-like n=1 Tax=Ipomoea triloba TaxID=35885 RepID=UPI00125DF5B2|nr:histone deacetylase HDT2-like [Ipomoea triloba]
MKSNSKALLDLEGKSTPSASSLESKLSFCNGEESFLSRSTKLNPPDKKPAISSIPQSEFLGKVKDFLGVILEANKNLELDSKTNPGKNYDIEALTGEESEYIEMDLMLGVAELQTEEAVAAAESALAGYQPVIPLAASSSETESEESSDDDDDSDEDSDGDDDDNGDGDEAERPSPKKGKTANPVEKDCSSSEASKNKQPRKKPKIVELS